MTLSKIDSTVNSAPSDLDGLRNTIIHGDCLDVLPSIPDGSVDMVLCDLPYGTTANPWDSIIPLNALWAQYKRVVKRDGAIVLTAQTPFDKVLGCSNLAWLRYEWVWLKNQPSGHLNAAHAPMKIHENVLVFHDKLPVYNPQRREGKSYRRTPTRSFSANYGTQTSEPREVAGGRCPVTSIFFARDPQIGHLHPTQKPVDLFRYLIRTYTNPGDLVLDNACGVATTAIAAHREGRDFICIERDAGYVEVGRKRLTDEQAQLRMFST